MRVYYNECNKKKCSMLNALMCDGHISKGDIDDRSIKDVEAKDLHGYDRCHFFAGIGLWDYALNLAGWKNNLPVWTGSCPCQPFSTAGRQKAQEDDRHLWPEWERLIKECRPATVFGEQVANAITKGWLDDVYQGLETQGYAVGSVVLPACSVGAPHKRDRLWFVADTEYGWQGRNKARLSRKWLDYSKKEERSAARHEFGNGCSMGNNKNTGLQNWRKKTSIQSSLLKQQFGQPRSNDFWQATEWINCPDNKPRAIEPSIPLLAHGDTERMGLIHAAGDAIVPEVAAEFISAYILAQE
ncbi:DNA cytosine methyltransferase [Agarilytica rhodophyticola]|uniref:DNA cytosine methyltransferase n=1 Tax=Agarilytica rhodophyticola TaxID=1737490 RepID=UPI000B3491EA|nr:DNA cytosine methyltransferase [Agarilytica rhodophyticola]